MTSISRSVVAWLVPLALSCRYSETATLHTRSAASCTRDAYFLDLPAAGGFVLNFERRDSTGVAQWLREVLPLRAGSGRNVNMRVAPGREADVAWLVPAIAHAGGIAYEFDPACHVEIP